MSNSTASKKNSGTALFKWLVIILFIWAIPSGLLWTGIYLFLYEECGRKNNQIQIVLESQLENISYDGSSARYFQNKLSKLYNSLKGRPYNPVSSLQNILSTILKPYPQGLLEVYLFDDNCNIIKTKGAKKELETFLQLAISDYSGSVITDIQTKEIGKFIPAPTHLLKRIRGQKGRAIETGNPDRYSLCYYHHEKSQYGGRTVAGILVFVHYEKLKTSLILSDILAKHGTNIGFTDPRESRLPKILSNTSINERFIENYFKLYPTNRFIHDSKLVCMKKLNNDSILVGALEITQPAWGLFAILGILFTIVSFCFLKFTYSIYVLHSNLGFNIRKRLIWLFILCYIFPLISSAILASQYLTELKSYLLIEEEFKNYKRLSEIDFGFSRFVTGKLMEYRNFSREIAKYVENPTVIIDKLKEKVLNNSIDSAHIISSDSLILLSSELMSAEVRRHEKETYEQQQEVHQSWVLRNASLTPKHMAYLYERKSINTFPNEKDRTEVHKAFIKVLTSTAASAMEHYNSSNNIIISSKIKTSSLVINALVGNNTQNLFQTVKTNLSNFTTLGGINEILYLFSDVLPGPAGEAWYAYAMLTNLDNLERTYLATVFKDIKSKNKLANKEFPKEDIRAISTYPYATCFPTIMEFTNFEPVLKQSNKNSKTFTHKMMLEGERAYVSVLRGAYLKHYLLLNVFPESRIEQLYKKQVNNVILLFVVIMVMGLALARLMTSLLILPITDIINGVKSIANNNYDYKIKVRSLNEFGIMSEAFNNTAESLKEMNISATMADFLFPEREFRCGSYLIYASKLTAQIVTCDFYDYLQLKQGTFAFITAKISGNDAISAYMMAMLKTSFITLMTAFPHSPDLVMNRLNSLFAPYSKQNHRVSCFIGILDPTNDTMVCTNAGQPYPITISLKKNENRFVDLPSTSLGISPDAKYTKCEVSLKHKLLVLYSHGVTEVTNQSGEKLGKDALLEIVSSRVKQDSQNISETILKQINSFAVNVPWREDISIITLQNKIQ